MSDFTVYPQRPALVSEVIQLWPNKSLSDEMRNALRSHVEGVVTVVWGTPAMHSAQAVLDTLLSPAKLQAALHAYRARAQDVALWADQFESSPASEIDESKHATIVAPLLA